MFGCGEPSRFELAVAAAYGHRRGRSEGMLMQMDESASYDGHVTPPTMDASGTTGQILSTRQTELAWPNPGGARSSRSYFPPSVGSNPGGGLQYVRVIQKLKAFSGVMDTMEDINDIFFIYCNEFDKDDATVFDETRGSIETGPTTSEGSETIDDTTLPSTMMSGANAPRDCMSSSTLETGPIYRDILDTRSDVNSACGRHDMNEGRDDVPNSWFSNPGNQPSILAHQDFSHDATKAKKKSSLAAGPLRQIPATAPSRKILAELFTAEEHTKDHLEPKATTATPRRIRSRSIKRNRGLEKKPQTVPSEPGRKSKLTKSKEGKDTTVSFRAPHSMTRARSVSGRNRRSIKTRDGPISSGKCTKSFKSRKTLKSAQQREFLSKTSACSTRGRSRSRTKPSKRESSRSISRRRRRSKPRAPSNRFSGRAVIDRLRGRSRTCRGKADLKTSEQDTKDRKDAKNVRSINQSTAPSELHVSNVVSRQLFGSHEDGILTHPKNGHEVSKEESQSATTPEIEGNVTDPPFPANISNSGSQERFVIELLGVVGHDKSYDLPEKKGDTAHVVDSLADAKGITTTTKTMLGKWQGKSLKGTIHKAEPEEKITVLFLSHPSKAGQASTWKSPRNLFHWRKNDSKAETCMKHPKDSNTNPSVDTTMEGQKASAGITFPVPNSEGQELALEDGNHCYDDPANVHSILTMPSFSTYLSKACQAPTQKSPRNLFHWRKNDSKAETGMKHPKDSNPTPSADTPMEAQKASTGIKFPAPNCEGQELALEDDNHCYDDPANVHSLLTMPTFQSTAEATKWKALRSNLKTGVRSTEENEDDRASQGESEAARVGSDECQESIVTNE